MPLKLCNLIKMISIIMGYLLDNKYSWFLPLVAFILFILITFDGSQENILLIGILSAPDHFEQRNSIRKSWLQDVGNDVTHFFLIGKHMCEIPQEDRIDEESCTELPVFLPEENKAHFFQSGSLICYEDNFEVPMYFGYSFTIQFDIIIKHIGILSNFCKQTVQVHLVEAATGHKITSATFLSNASSTYILWQNVEKYKLPKGFEGRIIWETSMNPDVSKRNCGFNWHSAGNIFAFHMYWNSNGLPAQFYNKSLSPITIGFEIPDFQELKNFQIKKPYRMHTWKNKVTSLIRRVEDEASIKGDILFLDVIDIYRSLAKKMLQFYKWADMNMKFAYLLKTDDDTYINITAVKKELYNLSQQEKDLPNRLWWWGVFREGWMIQWSGKWRETIYRSFTYPPFPCGAGYVLSRGTVTFLSSIADKLCTQYQGEDVAIGIWLSSTNPSSVVTKTSCSWTCDKNEIGDHNCNYPQLSLEEMKHFYERKHKV